MRVLSLEEYNNYLFGAHKFPSWDKNWEQLLIGVELEYLLLNEVGLPISKKQAQCIFQEILNQSEFKTRSLDQSNEILSIGIDTHLGFISIKPDFAYNILEVSFPPRNSPSELFELIDSTLIFLDKILNSQRVFRQPTSVLNNPNLDFEFVHLPRLKNYLESFDTRIPTSPPFHWPWFPAFISSTQIHLNILEVDTFKNLKLLYEPEWLTIPLFSNCQQFNGLSCKHTRTLLYEETFGPEYKLVTIPDPIPTNIQEYVNLFNSSRQIFPADPFFPVRDYTYVRPRSLGTVEFRSICSQLTTESIMEAITFRILQLCYALCHENSNLISPEFGNPRTTFSIHARENPNKKITPNKFEQETIRRLTSSSKILPPDWKERGTQLLKRILSL